LTKCTLLGGARVGSHSLVSNSIVGWDSTIGSWVRARTRRCCCNCRRCCRRCCCLPPPSPILTLLARAQCHITGTSVLGEDVTVADEVVLTGTIVLPHKELKASITTAGVIVM
jgi:mannose-1-phosphate guanylyltransferase